MSLEGAATAERPEASPQAASTTRPAAARFAKLRVHLRNIYRLVIKELRGVRSDPIMLALVAYSFTVAVYAIAT